jgi:hypothetical protein
MQGKPLQILRVSFPCFYFFYPVSIMPQLLTVLRLASLLIIKPVLAANYGYIESKECADPSGYAECYEARKGEGDDCIDKNCKGKNNDCIRACDCVLVADVIDCALTHCWNKVS